MYTLKNWGKLEGYEISYEELDRIIDTVYPEEKNGSIYQCVRGNRWEKNGNDRLYLKLRKSRSMKLVSEEPLGYYDYVNKRYIVSAWRQNVTDVIKEYVGK